MTGECTILLGPPPSHSCAIYTLDARTREGSKEGRKAGQDVEGGREGIKYEGQQQKSRERERVREKEREITASSQEAIQTEQL